MSYYSKRRSCHERTYQTAVTRVPRVVTRRLSLKLGLDYVERTRQDAADETSTSSCDAQHSGQSTRYVAPPGARSYRRASTWSRETSARLRRRP